LEVANMRKASALLLLLPAVLPLGCSRNVPRFQTAEVAPLTGAEALAGTWFDQGGNRMATLSSGTPAYLRVRLWPELRLLSARAEPDQVVLDCETSDATPLVLTLQLVDRDTVVLMRYGSRPSGCGTCTPYFVRDLPPGYRLEKRIERAKGAASALHDAAMDRLIGIF
jgi:hypothetical protein